MEQLVEPRALRNRCDELRRRGRRIGFVPTMGYLHRGHLSLVEIAADHVDDVVVSIFVNPTQFGPREDLSQYPRDREGDSAKCRAAGVALMFTPDAAAMYPAEQLTWVDIERLADGLCGARRPGHFRGVCTVVTKLLNIVGPCTAVFGEKDYQQLAIIRRMAADLAMPVEVVAGPIVREDDGLAMSSRNAYLDPEQRAAAPLLYRALQQVRSRSGVQQLSAEQVSRTVGEVLQAAPLVELEYVELRASETLEPIERVIPGRSRVLLAARIGKTRLIDNIGL